MMLWWVQQRSDPCRNEGTSSGMKEGCGVDMTMYSMVKGSALSWNATERVSVFRQYIWKDGLRWEGQDSLEFDVTCSVEGNAIVRRLPCSRIPAPTKLSSSSLMLSTSALELVIRNG